MKEGKQKTKNEKKGSRRRKGILLACALVLAAGTMTTVTALRGGSDEASAAAETTTQAAQVMDLENSLTSDGEVVSSLEEDLSPHTSYYLEEVKVEAGDALEEGDTILTYTNGSKMTAPYNCVVRSWSLPDEEEQLTTDHSVTVAGTDVLQMELDVGEDQIGLVKAGDEAAVTVGAADRTFDGVVTSVSEVGDYASSGSTFTARVTFDNDGSVKLGMSGTASIILEKAEKALCVPVGAVTTSGGESTVTVQKEDGTTEEVTVSTGIKNDAYIQITDGLSEGDLVAVPVSDEDASSGGSFMGMPGDSGQGPENGGGMPGGNGGPPGQ